MAKSKVKGNAKNYERKIARRLAVVMHRFGNAVVEDAQQSIRAGAVSGKGHVASAPGQPPNADTHRLDKSIKNLGVTGETATELRLSIVADAPYADHLEYGTRKMPARPFLRPALQRNRAKYLGDVLEALGAKK